MNNVNFLQISPAVFRVKFYGPSSNYSKGKIPEELGNLFIIKNRLSIRFLITSTNVVVRKCECF